MSLEFCKELPSPISKMPISLPPSPTLAVSFKVDDSDPELFKVSFPIVAGDPLVVGVGDVDRALLASVPLDELTIGIDDGVVVEDVCASLTLGTSKVDPVDKELLELVVLSNSPIIDDSVAAIIDPSTFIAGELLDSVAMLADAFIASDVPVGRLLVLDCGVVLDDAEARFAVVDVGKVLIGFGVVLAGVEPALDDDDDARAPFTAVEVDKASPGFVDVLKLGLGIDVVAWTEVAKSDVMDEFASDNDTIEVCDEADRELPIIGVVDVVESGGF